MKILTIDIGGTFIKYALMDENMEILNRGKIATPTTNREDLIETIGQVYDDNPESDGIAISMPGIIDSDNGYCAMGGALKYNDDFYLRHALYKRCPVHIHLENDAKCAAMAEAAVGSLKDVSDGFVLIFGTMIGGAMIKDHKLYKGKHFSAGEVSYITTIRNGMPTSDNVWGNRCGTPYLCKLYADAKGIDIAKVDGIKVFADINNGDEKAINCLQKFTKEITVQLFNIQTILDPEKIAIGGGISVQPVFLEYIKTNLKEMYASCPYDVPQAQVVTCKFFNDANLFGALQCFLANRKQGIPSFV